MSNDYSPGRRWPVFISLAPLKLRLQYAFWSQLGWHYTTLPVDRSNGYDNSYRSYANKPFGSSPTPFPSIVLSSGFWATFQTIEA